MKLTYEKWIEFCGLKTYKDKMEKSDFDPRLLEMTWECSHAILGGLSFGWDCVDKMKKSQEDDAEFVQAQILFVIKDYLDSLKTIE